MSTVIVSPEVLKNLCPEGEKKVLKDLLIDLVQSSD